MGNSLSSHTNLSHGRDSSYDSADLVQLQPEAMLQTMLIVIKISKTRRIIFQFHLFMIFPPCQIISEQKP